LIKLLIFYTLRDEKLVQDHGALPRIEAECLDIAFEEMRAEGFADDGLFLKMREFFLPLTISEYELHMKRQSSVDEHLAHMNRRDQLRVDIQQRIGRLTEEIEKYQKLDNEIHRLIRCIADGENVYMTSRSTLASRNDYEQQYKAEALHILYERWQTETFNRYQQLQDVRTRKDLSENEKKNLEKEIEEDSARLKTMELELSAPNEQIDKQLIKPPRGLIMYGPPGKFGRNLRFSSLVKGNESYMIDFATPIL
jgi:hypothetical protein